jgi:hypothetical protein
VTVPTAAVFPVGLATVMAPAATAATASETYPGFTAVPD